MAESRESGLLTRKRSKLREKRHQTAFEIWYNTIGNSVQTTVFSLTREVQNEKKHQDYIIDSGQLF